MNPDEMRDRLERDGHEGVISFTDEDRQEHYELIVETDYSYLCQKQDLSVVDEWRKHSVKGVRWL